MVVFKYQVVIISVQLHCATQISALEARLEDQRRVLGRLSDVEGSQILIVAVDFALVLKLLSLLAFFFTQPTSLETGWSPFARRPTAPGAFGCFGCWRPGSSLTSLPRRGPSQRTHSR